MNAAGRQQRPSIPLEALPAPTETERVEAERAQRRAVGLAAIADRGVDEAAMSRVFLEQLLDELEARVLEAPCPEAAVEILRANRWRLVQRIPFTTGVLVRCMVCHQVGEAHELVAHRLRWKWSGRDVDGVVVAPETVTQAREVGDMPPGLCPDHELEAMKAGLVPRRHVTWLGRAAIRRGRTP
jgi:hypothetical protein